MSHLKDNCAFLKPRVGGTTEAVRCRAAVDAVHMYLHMSRPNDSVHDAKQAVTHAQEGSLVKWYEKLTELCEEALVCT
jgi:hypothetical protein